MPKFNKVTDEIWEGLTETRRFFFLGRTTMHNVAVLGLHTNDGPRLHVVHGAIDTDRVNIVRFLHSDGHLRWPSQRGVGRIALFDYPEVGIKLLLPTENATIPTFRPQFNGAFITLVSHPTIEVAQRMPDSASDLVAALMPPLELEA